MSKYKEIGDRLRRLRGALSQQDFAKEIGTSFRAYQYYESGERIPPSAVLSKIVVLRGSTIEWILTGESNPLIQQLAAASAAHRGLDTSLIQQIAEAPAVYRLDTIEEKIVKLLEGMSEEEKRAVLKYVQAQKHLVNELKKQGG